MSRIRRMMELTPPAHEMSEETLVSVGHTCGYCHGNGWFWADDGRDSVKVPCPICKGKCEVDAVIAIKWRPSLSPTLPGRGGRNDG